MHHAPPGPHHRRSEALLLVIAAALVFDVLFWGQRLGLNLFLFTLLVTAVLTVRCGWGGLSSAARAALLGAVLAGAMVMVHGSTLAICVTCLALPAGAALGLEPGLRSLPFAYPWSAINFLQAPFGLLRSAGAVLAGRKGTRIGWRWVRTAMMPLLVGTVFFVLYRTGNPWFGQLTAAWLDGLYRALEHLLTEVFTVHTFFFLWGLAVCAALLHRFAPRWVLQAEQQLTDALLRRRSRRPHWLAPLAMNALERERRAGLILLVLVNTLLLVVNAIDIQRVWFGFTVPEGFSLKQFVHEGTYALIASILLGMVVLLYLFRGNQNFHPHAGPLRVLAYLWIAQNLVLGISVFLRNLHYIGFHGLASKRIGVILYLALVVVGLITFLIKVRRTRSAFYLLRVNAWAAFASLTAMTTVDWDLVVARYNLRHANRGEIDIDHYLALNDHVLPLLYADLDRVEAQMAKHKSNRVRWVRHLEPGPFRAQLDAKREAFLRRMATTSWPQWTLADARTHALLMDRSSSPQNP